MKIKNGNIIKWLIVLTISVISIFAVIILVTNVVNFKGYFNNNEQTGYNQTSIVSKIDLISKIDSDKKDSQIILEESKIIYVAGTSILTSKITNNGIARYNLSFKIKLISYDGSVIAQFPGYVGKIGSNEIKYVDSYISKNILDYKDIVYEIIN